ncbi:hypothetical protein ACP4OV_010326 [Aristida adscensionis]
MEDPPHCRHSHHQETMTTVSASEDQAGSRRPHLCIDIPAAASLPDHHLPTAMGADAATPGSNSGKRGPSSMTPVGSSSSGTGRSSSVVHPKPQRSPSLMLRQTVKSLLPLGSFKSSVKGCEASLSKLFNARISRTSSLPLRDVDALAREVDKSSAASTTKEKSVHICRSKSLPMNLKKFNAKSFKRMDSLGGMYRIVPSTPRNNAIPDIVPTDSGTIGEEDAEEEEDGGEDIPEEEAVCRICMVELSEGSDTTMKLECACKGELALAHKDCAVKWFSIKGTRNCEVCKQEVQNLPVTLLRLQSIRRQPNRAANGAARSRYEQYRLWHGTPILVIISILAYFCFLEELLIARNGIAALAISLPFSCVLGLFSSLTTTSMVARRYVWVYAAVQFLFVVFFTHLFYRYLHLQAVISIILATFAGFGVGMTGNSIVVEILRWRARRAPPPRNTSRRGRRGRAVEQQPPASDEQPSGQHSVADGGQRNAGVGDVENPAAPQA